MKKIILLFTAVLGMATLQSCEVNEVSDGVTQTFEAEVFEFTDNFGSDPNFSLTFNFSRPILDSDHVLIYRLYGTDAGADVWRLIPQTVYFNNGDEFDYNYDFTKHDFRVFLEGNFDLNTLSSQHRADYINNQTFRVVVVPGRFNSKMNFNDYNATIKNLGLENAKITQLKK